MSSDKTSRIVNIVVIYPFALTIFSIGINTLVFEVPTLAVRSPSPIGLISIAIAGILMVINHSWLMTTTELVRSKFKIWATPEEWQKSGLSRKEATEEGIRELERNHNAHRNSTENTVVFGLVAIPFLFTPHSDGAALVWMIGFAVSRIGHAYGYLKGSDAIRGIFMTLSLLAMYGLASHLAIAILRWALI